MHRHVETSAPATQPRVLNEDALHKAAGGMDHKKEIAVTGWNWSVGPGNPSGAHMVRVKP